MFNSIMFHVRPFFKLLYGISKSWNSRSKQHWCFTCISALINALSFRWKSIQLNILFASLVIVQLDNALKMEKAENTGENITKIFRHSQNSDAVKPSIYFAMLQSLPDLFNLKCIAISTRTLLHAHSFGGFVNRHSEWNNFLFEF